MRHAPRPPVVVLVALAPALAILGCGDDSGAGEGGGGGTTSGDGGAASTSTSPAATVTASSSSSTSASSSASTSASTSSSSSSTASSSATSSSSAGGLDCDDAPEPNDTFGEAEDVADDVSCGTTPHEVSGVLSGAADVDTWDLTLLPELCEGECGFLPSCPALPSLGELDPAGGDVEYCLFIECGNGAAIFDCLDGATQVSEEGLPGCCSREEFRIDVWCGNGDSSTSRQYLSARTDLEACVDYTMVYSHRE